MNTEWTLAQFCPCGHTANVPMTKVVDQVADPSKLDAPILSSSECPQCIADAASVERMYDLLDFD